MSLGNWTSHFEEIDRLLINAERQYGIAGAAQADNMIERFEIAIQTCTSISNGLENPSVTLNADEQSALATCKNSVGDLIVILRSLLAKWQEYRDMYNSTCRSTAYHVPLVHNGRRGRPRFDVDKDQLEYLLSLSFNWSEIAALLGISRMTLYRLDT